MYNWEDYLVLFFLISTSVAQIVPAYFGWRVFRLNGYAKYWSQSWILFIFTMLFLGFRRMRVAFDYDCVVTSDFIFDNIIIVYINSVLFSIYAILQYKFYSYWFDIDKLKTNKILMMKEERKKEDL